jgi:D-alanine-D-alanine ligase
MKLLVIFGGKSDEHEVSLLSARNVLRGLEQGPHDIIKVGITKDGNWYRTDASPDDIANGSWQNKPGNRPAIISPSARDKGLLTFESETDFIREAIDCVVPVLHGDMGEDGVIQGLFELAEIPYVGPGVKSSANCMDKVSAKTLVESTGVRMAKYSVIHKHDYVRDEDGEIERALAVHEGSYPLFIKPAAAGSSVGASKVTKREDVKAAVEEALAHDDKAMIEQMIVGRELEVAVLGTFDPKASCVGEILTAGEFYDYDSKYNNPESKTRIVEDLPKETLDEIRDYAVRIYKALECKCLSRVDFFYANEPADKHTYGGADGDGDSRIVFNEINTLPGFTNISMYPMLWENMGLPQPELLEELIRLAVNGDGN